MPWTREEKYLALLGDKIIENRFKRDATYQ